MGFEGLLGNDRLKNNLRSAFEKNRISHFYLICGPAGSGRHTLARLLAAAIMCNAEEKPCMTCAACRKVMNGNHPDFITVDDPEKKHVPVELVRSAREDIYIRPNEGNRKIYLFPRAQDMRVEAQNALLKVLEEPPAYGVFILLTDNPEKLLPTVRSRCTELALSALPEQVLKSALQKACPQATPEQLSGAAARSGGYLGQAIAALQELDEESQTAVGFLESYARSDTMGIVQILVSMEKWKRDALIEELQRWLQSITNALSARSGMAATQPMAGKIAAARTGQDLMKAVKALQKAITYARGNVSPAAICGYLSWELR